MGLRRILNLAYYDPTTVILPKDKFDYAVVDGFKFYISDQLVGMERIIGNPWFYNARPDDIVLDIGANIGAVAVPLGTVCRKVYAVEPLFHKELEANLKLNGISNVEILPVALGIRGTDIVEFAWRRGCSGMYPFRELRSKAGGKVDFLVSDCEGGEWQIQPEECQGIREIRIEFHIRKRSRKQDEKALLDWHCWLKDKGYHVNSHRGIKPIGTQFTEIEAVNASLI